MMISDLAGHCGRPPALPDCSLISTERRKNGPPVMIMTMHERHQEKHVADDVDAVAHPLRQQLVDDVDADMFVVEQRPWRAQQEHDAEQHPLQLEPGVGRGVEDLADDGVDRGHDHREQDQPRQALAGPPRERVDPAAQFKERLQR